VVAACKDAGGLPSTVTETARTDAAFIDWRNWYVTFICRYFLTRSSRSVTCLLYLHLLLQYAPQIVTPANLEATIEWILNSLFACENGIFNDVAHYILSCNYWWDFLQSPGMWGWFMPKIVKSCLNLSQLWPKCYWSLFFRTRCIIVTVYETESIQNRLRYYHEIFLGVRCGQKLRWGRKWQHYDALWWCTVVHQ